MGARSVICSRGNGSVYCIHMKYRFTTVLLPEGEWFVARALELGVVSQGKTQEEAEGNLKEAVELYLEDSFISREQLDRKPVIKSSEVEYA